VVHRKSVEHASKEEKMPRTITLKKIYKEVWKKKRGTSKSEFSGHTTQHKIDGVPAKKKEYAQAVSDICPDNLFLLLTNPRHFNSVMPWQDRRQTLLDICGDVTDQDVIDSDPDLSSLTDIIGKHSIDDYRKIIKSKLPEINREIQDIPVRISEVERSIPEDPRSIKTVRSVIAQVSGRRKELVEKRDQIVNGGEIAAARKELAEIDGKILTIDNEVEKERQAAARRLDKDRQELFNRVQEADAELKTAKGNNQTFVSERDKIKVEIDFLSSVMKDLRDEWNRVNVRELQFEQSDTCPTCGQAVPEDQLEGARQAAIESFNADKAQKLKMINKQGLEHKAEVTALEVSLKNADKAATETEADIKKAESKLAQAKQALDEFDRKTPNKDPLYIPPEKVALIQKQDTIRQKITDLEAGAKGDASEVNKEIAACDSQLEELNVELAQVEGIEKANDRIKFLAAEEKKLAAEYEKLEGHLFLTEKFIKAKVSMLTDKINSKFEMVNWKLFADQINGGLRECCIATVDGVPYDSLNNGARINAGLDIINVLSAHHGKTLPVFIDNAESVADLMPTMAQQIRLIVSPGDKELRIEGGE
jgi:capsule polysaccharide export protein KpsE/RkpR